MRLRKKQSRAVLRARSRRAAGRSNRWFAILMTVLVVALAAVMFFTVLDRKSASADGPQVGEHWHAAVAAYVCGTWLPNPGEFENSRANAAIRAGIHTHGDGFIHIHPFTSSEAGRNATFGEFLTYGGWSASADSVKLWGGPTGDPTKTTWSDGDRCPDADGNPGKGKPGSVVFEVDCRVVSGNPSDRPLRDQEILAIGFVEKGDSMPVPPNAASAPSNDGSPSGAINKKSCTPTAVDNPGVADTTPTTVTPVTTSTSP